MTDAGQRHSDGVGSVDTASEGVSTRVVLSVLEALERRGVPWPEVLEGTGLDRATVADPRRWVSYDTYCAVARRAEGRLDRLAMEEFGTEAFRSPAIRAFAIVGWTLPSEVAAFQWMAKNGFGPHSQLFRAMTCTLREVSERDLEVDILPPAGREVPMLFRYGTLGAFRAVPTLLGGRPAKVEVSDAPGGALRYRIGFGARSSRVRRVLRAAAGGWTREDAAAEARQAYEALLERNEELHRRLEEVAALDQQRQRLEERLIQQQKLEAIGRVAGNVAHDFNNVLAVILGRAELLLSGMGAEEAGWESASVIRDVAERAAALTEQLLAFGRDQVLDMHSVRPADVVRANAAMLRSALGETHVLDLELDEKSGHVRTDPNRFAQALLNLIVNARDALPESGGRVTLSVRREHLTGGAIGVSVEVRDDGRGMDRATRERAFEPFFTTKSREQGTGLGLSTVYGIVSQSGGQVTIESEVGRGTTVRVRLAEVDAPADEAASASERESAAARRKVGPHDAALPSVVLLVDDNKNLRTTLKLLLESSGMRVLSASNADEALAMGDDPDLVLTDVVLPKLGGRRLAETLRERRPELPVVFMSGYTEHQLAQDGAVPSGCAFLRKPFDEPTLLEALRRTYAAAVASGASGRVDSAPKFVAGDRGTERGAR